MEREKCDLTVFFCTHQERKVEGILKGWNGGRLERVRRVSLPCSGKLEVFQLTKALENGSDAVALFGCPEGACRYLAGSSRAKGRVAHAQRILQDAGLEKNRIARFVLEEEPGAALTQEVSSWLETVRPLWPLKAKG